MSIYFIWTTHLSLFAIAIYSKRAHQRERKGITFWCYDGFAQVPRAAKLFYHGARKQSAISLSIPKDFDKLLQIEFIHLRVVQRQFVIFASYLFEFRGECYLLA
jgi:hypothetical protein